MRNNLTRNAYFSAYVYTLALTQTLVYARVREFVVIDSMVV